MQITKIAGVLVLAAAWTVNPAQAATPDGAPESTLTVTGQGVISRAPDQAVLSVSIVTNDDNASRALSDNNAHYATLVAKIGAAGIAANAIRTTGLNTSFNPRPEQVNPQYAARYGYVVSRYVQLTVNILDTTGAVIDAAASAGATTIGGVTYGFRDSRAVERAALAAAVSDASEQARAVAEAAHVRIVRILHIGDNTSPIVRPLVTMDSTLSLARAAPALIPTTLPPSNLDVHASIAITYIIAP